MSARLLHRIALGSIVLIGIVILYITLVPEPPHWGSVMPSEFPGNLGVGRPPQLAPPPGWTPDEEEAVGHSLMFFALGVASALWYATSAAARRAPQRTLLMTMVTLWLFAGISEALQGFTATRAPQLSDLAFQPREQPVIQGQTVDDDVGDLDRQVTSP